MFKVGDYVTVFYNPETKVTWDPQGAMKKFVNKRLKITHYFGNGKYELNNMRWKWHEDCLKDNFKEHIERLKSV